MTNRQVAQSWFNGQACKSSNGNLHTDGANLYSRDLRIGATLANGEKLVLGVRGEYSLSSSTSNHVRLALIAGGTEVTPERTNYPIWDRWKVYTFPQHIRTVACDPRD